MSTASVNLSNKKSRYSDWTGWGIVSGSDPVFEGYSAFCVYKANMSLAGTAGISAINLNTTLALTVLGSVTSKYVTVRCYLYENDPTVGNPTSTPSGYTAYATVNRVLNMNGANVVFQFSNLNITSGSELYFWFTSSTDISDGSYIEIYSSNNPYCTVTDIPFNLTLSISPGTVTTGAGQDDGLVTITIGNGNGLGLTVYFSYGNTALASEYTDTGQLVKKCPKSWFDTAGVTYLKSMTVNVMVTGGPTNTPTGSFTLAAGNDMKPSISDLTHEVVQPSQSIQTAYPSTYIAGFSKCKVSCSLSFPTNADLESIKLSFPGGTTVNMSYNSSTEKYEGITDEPVSGDVTFTVTVKDVRNNGTTGNGMTSTGSVMLVGVVAYTPPAVVVNDAYRCDSEGTQEEGGAYWKIKVTASVSSNLSGNSVQKLTAEIKNSGSPHNLPSGQWSDVFSGMSNPNTRYTVVVEVEDKITAGTAKEVIFARMARNVVVKRSGDGTYVGVGMAPSTASGESFIEMPEGAKIIIGGQDITAWLRTQIGGNW